MEINLENLCLQIARNTISEFLNKILLEERKYLSQTQGISCNGFYTRNLKLQKFLISLQVPRLRCHTMEYSLFAKFQRRTEQFNQFISNMYSGRIYEREISQLVELSCIPREIKTTIKQDFLLKYNEFLALIKPSYSIIKLDAMSFGSMKSQKRNTAYFVWGMNNKLEKKCLYFHVDDGNECGEGWEKCIDFISKSLDLTDTKVIVSDQHKSLKMYLREYIPQVPKQNCIWHKLNAIIGEIVGLKKQEKGTIFSENYYKFLTAKTPEDIEAIFKSFSSYTFTAPKKRGISFQYTYESFMKEDYEDNFTYLTIDKQFTKQNKKCIIQSMDIESINSDLRFHIGKYKYFIDKETIIIRIMMFLESKNYI